MNESSQADLPQHHPHAERATILAVVALLAIGGAALHYVVRAREDAQNSVCTGHLKTIALAMLNYREGNGCFPPAYIADKSGRPLHSWRVLLVPWYCDAALYRQFHLDEPWDSAHNLAVAKASAGGGSAAFYHCPSDCDSDPANTSYVMVVGPDTISGGPTSTSTKGVADRTLQTVMIVEMSDSGILWTEPRDLDLDTTSLVINNRNGEAIRSWHRGHVNVALFDGSVVTIQENVSPEVLKALLQRHGGGFYSQ